MNDSNSFVNLEFSAEISRKIEYVIYMTKDLSPKYYKSKNILVCLEFEMQIYHILKGQIHDKIIGTT